MNDKINPEIVLILLEPFIKPDGGRNFLTQSLQTSGGNVQMAFVHEIKFFKHDDRLFSALFEASTRYCSDHWMKNIPAQELGIEKLPDHVSLEQKYSVEELGIKPFFYYATVPKLEFIDPVAESMWKT